ALVSRRDVIVVASVSCIFGLGSPEDYKSSVIELTVGSTVRRDDLLKQLVDLQYMRNDLTLKRSTFRVRGDVIELHPSYEEFGYRIDLFGDQIDRIELINTLTGETLATQNQTFIFPAVHYVMPQDRVDAALQSIREELEQRLSELRRQGKLLEAQRLA